MDKKKVQDPETARFIRRQHKQDGVDEQQQNEDASFYSNPTRTINKHGKQRTQKSIQKQVEYFGNAIQPFHMRQQQDLGQIDEEGYFVFDRKKRVRDPWLDSIGEADDGEVADQISKRIKQTSRFQSVYEAGDQINKDLAENQQEEEQEQYEGGGIQQVSQSKQSDHQQGFKISQLVQIMIELIPERSNANNYMKKLKTQKNMDDYNKLLTISNQYIEKTGEYDILIKKREQLEQMLEEILEKERKKEDDERNKMRGQQNEKQNQLQQVLDWNNDDSEQQIKQKSEQKQNDVQIRQKQRRNIKNNQVQEAESDSEEQGNDEDNDNIF